MMTFHPPIISGAHAAVGIAGGMRRSDQLLVLTHHMLAIDFESGPGEPSKDVQSLACGARRESAIQRFVGPPLLHWSVCSPKDVSQDR